MTPQELKNSILQWAIQGKLVEQRPEEGTAEELYQQIQAEKQRLIKEGKIKKEKPLPEIAEEEKPFKIPESWKWVRLGEIGYTNIGLTYKPTNIANDGIIVLRSNNIYNNRMDYSDIVKVQMNIPKSKMCYKGDILICVRNGSKKLVGKSAIIDQNGMSFGAFMAVFRSMCNNYVFQVIASAYFKNSLLRETGTTTINQITQDMLKTAFIPLPPLAEQKRIVAKIEELLPNYHYEDLARLAEMYEKWNLKNPAVIVDVNHSNSSKQYKEQIRIVSEVLHSRNYNPELKRLVKGVMIESYLVEGRQDIAENLVYGQSITDPCIGWEDTQRLIYDIAEKC